MTSDTARPGEIELEAASEPVAETVETPTQDTTAETPAHEAVTEPEAEPPADAAAEPAKQQPRGAVAELIQLRREKKQLADRLQQIESNPVLQRLTPEVQQAIVEGRLTIQPPQSNADLEKQRLETVSQQLGLVKADGTPDIDAARRVDTYVRGTVQAAVAPIRNMTLTEKADQNIALAIQHAKANNLPVEVIEETYAEIRRQPNGAQLLAQAEVATTVWHQALGRAFAQGKMTSGKAQPAQSNAPTMGNPPVVVTETTGRRQPGASVTLSPKLAQVYKDAGLDPNKGFSTKLKPDTNLMGIELE